MANRTISHLRAGLSATACVALALMASASVVAGNVKMDVQWADAASKPARVELQGNAFGTKPFLPADNRFTLQHDFDRVGKPPRIVIVYGGVSTAISVRPQGEMSVMSIMLNIKAGQYCDLNFVKAVEQRSRSNDYHTVLSSTVQAELVLATDTCSVADTRRLEKVRVDSRCRLTELQDFFDIADLGFAGFEQQIAACKSKLIAKVTNSVLAKINNELKKNNLTAASEAYADLTAIIQDEDWTAALADMPVVSSNFKIAQSRYLVMQLITSQSLGNVSEANFLRQEVLQLRSNPDYAQAFDFYSSNKLDEILRKNFIVTQPIQVGVEDAVIVEPEPITKDIGVEVQPTPEF